MGKYFIKCGQREASTLIIANGKHLITATISAIGLVIGLIVIKYTGLIEQDHVLAIVWILMVMYTGIQIFSRSDERTWG
jgi:divalent metal cation (Fe/Co/Zn/Cd) transporter